jgi:predicted PurR-regulated permease PerM
VTWSVIVIGVAAALAICHFAEEVLVIILVSVLLSFILDPVAYLFTKIRFPRPLAAAISVVLLLGLIGGIAYLGVNQAANLLKELPNHSSEIRRDLSKFSGKLQKLEVLNPPPSKGAVPVQETPSLPTLLTRGFGSVSEAVLGATFIPFLVFFMLTWQEHARSATVGLVATENRRAAYVSLGLMSAMIRNFMVGNLIIGLVMGGVSTVVFGILGIPFFYFAGFLSGFFSLVPYLGVLIALLPPLFLGIGHLSIAKVIIIVVTVFTLHIVSINVLYPKFIGGRLRLNPLTVTIALLVWGWLWGAVGLVLAIPITGGMKIVFDHVQPLKPFGAWLAGEKLPNGST